MAGLDANTLLLLPFDGADESTAIVDTSSSGHIMTPVLNAMLDTDQSKFGGSSAIFAGGPDYYTAPDSPDWDIIHGKNTSMTLDFWVRFRTVATSQGMCGSFTSSSNYWYLRWWTGGTLLLQMRINGAINQLKCAWTGVNADQWYHIALVRNGSTARYIFIDGVSQALTVDTRNGSDQAGSAVIEIGNAPNSGGFSIDGWMEEFRLSDIPRWITGFTPPTEAYSPPPIVNTDIEVFQPQAVVSRQRFAKRKTNPGWSVVAGLHIPVPIKLDKWEPKNAVPVKDVKRNIANVTQNILVQFNTPPAEVITIDKWFQQHPVPVKRFEKKILRPSEFMFNDVESWQEKNGNFQDTGVFSFEITKESTDSADFLDNDAFGFTITGAHVEDFQLEDAEPVTFTISNPDIGNESFNSGVPGFVTANVTVNGVNESGNISGVISVTREDNTAARFKFILNLDQTAVPLRKPSELINKVVEISFGAADMDGVVADAFPIFKGICKGVSFSEDQQAMNVNGYDYGGIHQTKGELVSANVTTVLTGSIGVSSAGTHSLGHAPVWGVVWNGNSVVTDGEDYFINTLNGSIIVPISSRILQFPGSFTFNYQSPFGSMKEIIQSVATLKGWTLQEDNVTIADYSGPAEHPVLSLSDESVVDVCRKFLECSGAKVESNLFPKLRVYSEVQNVINTVNTHTVDEDIIFEDSQTYRVDFNDILNEQTTRSVQKINANVVVSGSSTIAEFSGSQGTTDPRKVQTDVVWWANFDLSTPTVLVQHRVKKTGLNSISFSSSGSFTAALIPFEYFNEPITGASWNSFIDGDDFVIQLKHTIVTLGGGGIQMWTFPAVDYSLTVSGSKINYGDGTIEDVKIVTAQRPISGVADTLKGDVYENAYIETDQHCANICDAILLEHGNPYTTQFEIPVFEGRQMNIGDRIDIEKNSIVKFKGIIKQLIYSIDLRSGANSIRVSAKGVGIGM